MKPWKERYTFISMTHRQQSLNINEHDNAFDFSLAIEIAKYAGITRDEANEAVQRTKKIVAQWPNIATNYGISREEQELMSPAFKV